MNITIEPNKFYQMEDFAKQIMAENNGYCLIRYITNIDDDEGWNPIESQIIYYDNINSVYSFAKKIRKTNQYTFPSFPEKEGLSSSYDDYQETNLIYKHWFGEEDSQMMYSLYIKGLDQTEYTKVIKILKKLIK